MRKQSGFTLIELAIVLVIIGLLLGSVLKGQQFIGNAKAKSIIADYKNVQTFIYGYQDKFRAIPGDDPKVEAHINGATLATTGGTVGDSRIGGSWNTTTLTDESALFWEHVRRAGFATGPTTIASVADLPRNAENGRLGVQSVTGFTTIKGMTGAYVVCSENISGSLAKQVDANLDDGETSTGFVRAVTATSTDAVTSTAMVDEAPHTVCMTF